MAFDPTKYDIELNGVGHRIEGYTKSESPSFVPRISNAKQTDTEFSTLLSRSLDGFGGGQLQRKWLDDTSIFASEGMYPIYDDDVLYPVDGFTDPSGVIGLIGKSQMTAFLSTKDYVWIAYQSLTAPANFVKRIYKDGTQQSITLPSNLSSSTRTIQSIVIFDNKVWFGTSDGLTGGYLATITATTITELGTGTAVEWLSNLVVYKGNLYGTDGSTGSASNAVLRRHTGGTSSRSIVLVGDTGKRNYDGGASLLVYNGRIMLLREDGMWAYDGVSMNQIEDASNNPPTKLYEGNYKFPQVLNGYLYYFMPDGFYRFNGSLIEKLYDNSEVGFPTSTCIGKNRIWISYANSALRTFSRYDKSLGYDYSTGDNIDGRVAVFNGKAMYTYGRLSTFIRNPATADFATQDNVDKVFWFADKIWVTLLYSKGSSYHTASTAELELTGTKSWRIITSIFDADFAMVDKNIENFELVTDGNNPTSESITIEYRTAGFSSDSGWTTAGTFNTTTELKRYIWRTLSAGISGKKFQFRLSGTTTAGYGIARFIIRYTLQPDFKWQWQFDVLNYGDNALEPLLLGDGTSSSQAVRTLRGNIYASRSSDTPVKYIDVDQLDLNEALDNSETGVDLNSTALLKGDDGFIQIDDEIMYWYAKTATVLTVIRGVLGTTPASHTDNSKVFMVYRVFVKQITRESVIMRDGRTTTAEDINQPSRISIVLGEV